MKTLNKLSKDEEKSINLSGKYDTLFIHDIENTIGYKKPDHKEDSYFTELLEELDSELGVKDNDLVIIAGNKHLLNKANNLHYKDTPCEEIILPAGGSDGADLKLLAAIQRLFSQKKIQKFKKVVIVSGDNIFSSWVRSLKRFGIDVETVSLRENTCREFRISYDHKYLKNFFETEEVNNSYA